jgi:hypothetical protein
MVGQGVHSFIESLILLTRSPYSEELGWARGSKTLAFSVS